MMLYQETSRSDQYWSLQTLGYEYYDEAGYSQQNVLNVVPILDMLWTFQQYTYFI